MTNNTPETMTKHKVLLEEKTNNRGKSKQYYADNKEKVNSCLRKKKKRVSKNLILEMSQEDK